MRRTASISRTKKVSSIEAARALPTTCFRITEELLISNSDLTDFRLLSGLSEVKDLIIEENTDLESLDGLENVKVTGSITIERNPRLKTLENLVPSPTIKGDILLLDNESLETIVDFGKLITINGDLRIDGNTSLPNLESVQQDSEGSEELRSLKQRRPNQDRRLQ